MSKLICLFLLSSLLGAAPFARADSESTDLAASQPIPSAACTRMPSKKPSVQASKAATGPEAIEQSVSGMQHLVLNCAAPVEGPSGKKPDSSLPVWLDFVRHLVDALVWPIVAVLIGWRLGPELKRKLPLLRRLEAGPLKAEFDEEVEAVRKEVEEQFPQAQAEPQLSPDEARLLEIAKVSPRSAITEAWRSVEVVANRVVERRLDERPTVGTSLRTARPKSTISLARDLSTLELLTPQQLSVFHELRNLRNQAAHTENFEMDFQSANNYIQSALALKSAIQGAGETA